MYPDPTDAFSHDSLPSRARRKAPAPDVTESRAAAQRVRINGQRNAQQTNMSASGEPKKSSLSLRKKQYQITLSDASEAYISDQIGGNHSEKTLEWHRTALGFFKAFLESEQSITLVQDIESVHISAWLASLRTAPSTRGKIRSERTIQTYARSVRAFCRWLVRRQLLEHNPFDHIIFPKVGKPLIQTITAEEFEKLLWACAAPNETGPIAERAAVRNRAILWVLYDTGIRVSELCGLREGHFDRKHGVLTVQGKGSKERRVALGQNCLRHLLYYLDHQRPDEEELAEWGSSGEDHLFLSETRLPFTKNGMTLLCPVLGILDTISG